MLPLEFMYTSGGRFASFHKLPQYEADHIRTEIPEWEFASREVDDFKQRQKDANRLATSKN